jgi:hypothetical protein
VCGWLVTAREVKKIVQNQSGKKKMESKPKSEQKGGLVLWCSTIHFFLSSV